MHMKARLTPWRRRLTLALALWPLLPAALRAQAFDLTSPDWLNREPALPRFLDGPAPGDSGAARANRIRLFRITPGFLSDPVGLDTSDDPPGGPQATPPMANDAGPDWLNLAMGNDNPFFDFRRPGDPGGVGYFKVHTQVQLLDDGTTGCTLGLQAWMPAGLESNGLDDGAKVLSPALSLYHQMDDGTALQGFVSKNLNLNALNYRLHHSLQYGVALQRPVGGLFPELFSEGPGNVYVFVEALGRYRYDGVTGPGPASVWEVLPGVQWRLSDNWWVTGGVSLPVGGTTSPDPRPWQGQVTCSVQF
jgi:hypothetical protein